MHTYRRLQIIIHVRRFNCQTPATPIQTVVVCRMCRSPTSIRTPPLFLLSPMLTTFIRTTSRFLTRAVNNSRVAFGHCAATSGTSTLPISFAQQMADALQQAAAAKDADKTKKRDGYRPRYDGRAKKRNWVDYRNNDKANGDAPADEATLAATAEKRANFNPADRVKRKKCCLLLGYSGVNYFGMQRNPAMKTIEEDLLAAMLKVNWITEDGYKQAQTIQFQRAARTDKGVSAARQCVSLKLPDDTNIEAINAVLPEQIRVFCVRRVTKGFNSKEKCCGRTYTYTLPTVAFANHDEPVADPIAYRCDPAKVQRINELLSMYVGTHCFHNFTSRKEFVDPSAKRFIVSFECGAPFVEAKHGIELAVLRVKGQSFMLHQIRKMIGLVLAVLRGHTGKETIERAFGAERIDVPMAPGLGLVLDQVHYDRYNERYASDGIHEALEWSAVEQKIGEFFDTFIRPTIVETEVRDASMVNWMQTLSLHTYDVRVEGVRNALVEGEDEEAGGDDDGDDDDVDTVANDAADKSSSKSSIVDETKKEVEIPVDIRVDGDTVESISATTSANP